MSLVQYPQVEEQRYQETFEGQTYYSLWSWSPDFSSFLKMGISFMLSMVMCTSDAEEEGGRRGEREKGKEWGERGRGSGTGWV